MVGFAISDALTKGTTQVIYSSVKPFAFEPCARNCSKCTFGKNIGLYIIKPNENSRSSDASKRVAGCVGEDERDRRVECIRKY